MQYPLRLSFKKLSVGRQIHVTDASYVSVLCVRQNPFGRVEDVIIRASPEGPEKYRIDTERIADFSRQYYFTDEHGVRFGSVRQYEIMKPWRAHYQIYNELSPRMTIREVNPFVRGADILLGLIPVVNWFNGYMIHPSYSVTDDSDGTVIATMTERSSFWKRALVIEKAVEIGDREQTLVLLSLLMILLRKIRWNIVIT